MTCGEAKSAESSAETRLAAGRSLGSASTHPARAVPQSLRVIHVMSRIAGQAALLMENAQRLQLNPHELALGECIEHEAQTFVVPPKSDAFVNVDLARDHAAT